MKDADMKVIKCNIQGLKESETDNFVKLLSLLTYEEERIKLSKTNHRKEFLENLMECFEYETKAEEKEEKAKYNIRYKECRLNAEKYFENIKYFIDYHKAWKVKDWNSFSKIIIDLCATLDANANNPLPDVEHFKCIAECVEKEVEGYKTSNEINALITFIAMQTVMSKRNRTGKLKELCDSFIKGKMSSKDITHMKTMLKDNFKDIIRDSKKNSLFKEVDNIISSGKITEKELEEIFKETQDLMK